METMKTPGPDHPISVTASRRRLLALYQGHVIADSTAALELREAGYRPVAYFPRADVAMAFMGKTARSTHCPYKGHASYFTLDMDGTIAENAAWSYETPYPAMTAITGAIAFYPNLVEVREAHEQPHGVDVDAVVQHTDSGGGSSQREHWPATAGNPPTAT